MVIQNPIIRWAWDCRSLLLATAILAAWMPFHGLTGGALPMLLMVAVGWAFEAVQAVRATFRQAERRR